MLGIMLQKMWHKRWMNLSLLLGCVLLVATVVSFPLYQKAAYDRMLQDEFRSYVSKEGEYPTYLEMRNQSKKDKGGKAINKMEALMDSLDEELGVTRKQNIFFYCLSRMPLESDLLRPDASDLSMSLAGYSDVENHIEMISGECFSEKGVTDDGAIEVIVSQDCLVNQGLLLGETLTFTSLKGEDGKPVKIYIKGVFKEADKGDYYWQSRPIDIVGSCVINMDLFKSMFTGDNAGKYIITCNYVFMFDYEKVKEEHVAHLAKETAYLTEESGYRSVIKEAPYTEILDEYALKINRISATLVILQIPILVMLSAFLFMISGQMYEMERNEISVIKSRGSSRNQIFRLYLYQGLVLSIAGALIGFPLGALFSRILGAVRNFLDFDTSRTLNVVYTKQSLYYAAGAMLITLLSITLPAIKHSKVSIVNLKQQKAVKKKIWWEKLFIDVILIGVSLYGYYSFNRNMKDLSGEVLSGKSLDPLLYISSSLLIIGLGLFFLRIQPYIVKLIYLCGKKFWHPAAYISFMETIKTGRKKHLIMLFLILTVSLGMYHSTVARTILENAIENTNYKDGTDVVLQEKWTAVVDTEGAPTGEYIEPKYAKFGSMDFADSYTRVYNDTAGFVKSSGKNSRQNITILGIHTKEYGQISYIPDDITEKPYFEYLNELAVEKNGALLSRNFQTKLGYKVGDMVTFYDSLGNSTGVKIVDFFDYWPSYALTSTTLDSEGNSQTTDNYLLVTHFELYKSRFGNKPYEVWISMNEGSESIDMYNWIEDMEVNVKKYSNRADDLDDTMQDPLLQGTNGVLTMGFIVTLLLCAVGYLIYWIMSIKERELIFGVLRACGFHKGEVVHMLLNEQIFCGVFAVLAGIGIGFISSKMFVPIIQLSYASTSQILPLRLITSSTDLTRLFVVIAAVMVVCFIVLIALLFHMNVTKALKLGEE